jgi:hypothetical protein
VSRPQLLLHIGQHKTGSKALQAFLACHQESLREIGVCYPLDPQPVDNSTAYGFSHFRLYKLLRDGLDPHPFLSAADAACRAAGARYLVLSAEDLIDMQSAHETAISLDRIRQAARALSESAERLGYDLRVVVYLRRQDHLLGAHYIQYIKGSSSNDMEMAEFARAIAPRLDSSGSVAIWEELGRDRIQVRPYERNFMPGGVVADFFKEVLDLPVPAGEIPTGVEVENRSIDRDHVEFIRLVNRGHFKLNRDIVLEVAHKVTNLAGPKGIAAWLSPRERRDLLERHAAGNARIARELTQCHVLFREPLPEDAEWQPYGGLSPARCRAILWAVCLRSAQRSLRRWLGYGRIR